MHVVFCMDLFLNLRLAQGKLYIAEMHLFSKVLGPIILTLCFLPLAAQS